MKMVMVLHGHLANNMTKDNVTEAFLLHLVGLCKFVTGSGLSIKHSMQKKQPSMTEKAMV